MEVIHPRRLIGKRNLSEADQGDVYATRHQTSDQLAGVSPRARERIGGDQDVHRTSSHCGNAAPDTEFRDSPIF